MDVRCENGWNIWKKFRVFLLLSLVIGTILLISPVSAELGYTQKWMSSSAWLQEKAPVSTFEPKLFKNAELMINTSQFTTNYINAGKDYLIAGAFNDAKISFDTALEKESDSFDGWLGRGFSQEALKRYQSALESYDTAIRVAKVNKNRYLAYAGKGRSSLETRNYPGAAVAFEKAIEAYESSGYSNQTELSHLQDGLADARKNSGQQSEADNATQNTENQKVGA